MPPSARSERATQLLETAGRRSRMGLRERRERLLVVFPALMQTAVATALAWLAATELLGHPAPFLAVIAAIIVLSQAYGQRARRAVEFAVGVVLGVLVADLVLLELGTGAAQIGLIVLLAMVAAVVLGAGRGVVTQAATTAALVATVNAGAVDFSRAVDALLGGTVALLVAFVLLPVDPVRFATGHRAMLLDHLAAALEDVAAALGAGDHDRAAEALACARDLDGYVAAFAEAAMVGGEIARGAPLRRGACRSCGATRPPRWSSTALAATCASWPAVRFGPPTSTPTSRRPPWRRCGSSRCGARARPGDRRSGRCRGRPRAHAARRRRGLARPGADHEPVRLGDRRAGPIDRRRSAHGARGGRPKGPR